MRRAQRLQGVVDETSKYLVEEAVRARNVNIDSKALDLDASGLATLLGSKGGVAISDVNSVWTATETIFRHLIASHSKHAKSLVTVLNQIYQAGKEQSDILWWILSEHTLDGVKSFSDLTVAEACFWGAGDLADLTIFLPGPLGGPAFLHRMLRTVKAKLPGSLEISECIEACKLDWSQKLVAEIEVQQLPDLCPMLFGLAKSVEVSGGNSWITAFENLTGLKGNAKAAPVRLASQIYNELLLLRALAWKG
jgi:hypothetical protein